MGDDSIVLGSSCGLIKSKMVFKFWKYIEVVLLLLFNIERSTIWDFTLDPIVFITDLGSYFDSTLLL